MIVRCIYHNTYLILIEPTHVLPKYVLTQPVLPGISTEKHSCFLPAGELLSTLCASVGPMMWQNCDFLLFYLFVSVCNLYVLTQNRI